MSNKQTPPTSVIVALTIVTLAVLGGLLLMVTVVEKSAIPEGWIAIFGMAFASLVAAIVGLVRTEQANGKLDQVLNGKMDAKIEGGVHRAMDEREARSAEGRHQA